MAEAGADVVGVDWRVPLDVARRRVGAGNAVQGNLDPAICLAPGRWSRPRCARCWPQRRATPATSSTSATACCPRPIPACSSRIVELVHAEGRATTRRRRDRRSSSWPTARRLARRRRGYYTDIRRGRPADARAARRPRGAATTPSAGSRRWPSAPRPSARRSRPRSTTAVRAPSTCVLGQEARRAVHRGRRRGARRRGIRARRRAGARAALLGVQRRRVPRRGRRRRPGAAVAARRHRPGTSSRPTSTSSPRPCRRPGRACRTAQGAVHRPLAARARCWRGDPYPDQLRESAAAVAERVGLCLARLGHRLAERRAHARAVARARHPRR